MNTENTQMLKFYVQSADCRWVLLAPNLDAAAIRFAHCVLRDCVRNQTPSLANANLVDEDIYEDLVTQFGDTVLVSEAGFESEHLGIFATPEVLSRWHEQMENLQSIMRKREEG